MVTPMLPTFVPVTTPSLQPLTNPTQAPVYKKSIRWDWRRGDVVRDARGGVVEASGYLAWADWCVKACITQRYVYPVYSFRYGVDLASAQGEPTEKIAVAILADEISSALLADPRTRSVENFAFVHEGDGLRISFDVTPQVGTPERISVVIDSP